MTESKRRPRSLKGAVLVMVLTILFILMVMLLATLAVVSSTTQRTYTKFEETQAYYTARSVLEVYIDNFLSGKDTYADDSHILDAMKNGGFNITALPEDPATHKKKDFSDKDLSLGFAHQQEIFGYLTPKYEWHPAKITGSNPKDEGLGLTEPSDNNNWVKRTDAESKKDYAVEYQIRVPQLGGVTADSSKNFGELDSDQLVTVRVELLRVLYVNQKNKELSDRVQSTVGVGSTGKDGKMFIDASQSGADENNTINWGQTYYRLKVTSTANLAMASQGQDVEQDNEVSVSVLLEPIPSPTPSSFKNAMTSIADTLAENQIFTIGGASANPGTGNLTKEKNNGSKIGNYIYHGNFEMQNAPEHWLMTSGQYYVVYDGYADLTIDSVTKIETNFASSDSDSTTKLANRPYLYADGMLFGESSQIKLGSSGYPIDLIACGENTFSKLKNYTALGGTPKSKVSATDLENLALVIGNGQEKNHEIYGNIYADGSVYISPKAVINGTIYCTETVYIDVNNYNATSFSNCKIYAKNVVYLNDSNGNANKCKAEHGAVGAAPSFSLTRASAVAETNNAETFATVTLPVRGEVQLPTVRTITNDYRDAVGHIIPAEDRFKTDLKQSTASLTVSSDVPTITKSSGTSVSSVTGGDGKTYNISGKLLNIDGDNACAKKNATTGLYEMKIDFSNFMGTNSSDIFIIDATKENLQIEICGQDTNNSCQATFVVIGDNSVRFTMANKNPGKTSQQKIVCKDASFFNYQIYNMCKSNDVFYLGELVDPTKTNTPASPNMYWYIDKNVLFQYSNADNSRLCGYFYGPEADLDRNVANNVGSIKAVYNMAAQRTVSKAAVFGSVVFHSISAQNPQGVVYIANSGGGGNAGGAGGNINWGRQRYLNS